MQYICCQSTSFSKTLSYIPTVSMIYRITIKSLGLSLSCYSIIRWGLLLSFTSVSTFVNWIHFRLVVSQRLQLICHMRVQMKQAIEWTIIWKEGKCASLSIPVFRKFAFCNILLMCSFYFWPLNYLSFFENYGFFFQTFLSLILKSYS